MNDDLRQPEGPRGHHDLRERRGGRLRHRHRLDRAHHPRHPGRDLRQHRPARLGERQPNSATRPRPAAARTSPPSWSTGRPATASRWSSAAAALLPARPTRPIPRPPTRRRARRRPRPGRRVAGEVQRRRLRLEQGGLRRHRSGRPPATCWGSSRRATCSTRPTATTAPTGEPSLAEMTAKAIDILSQNDKGYVLMVEAGRIDHAHHAGNAYRALDDTIALDAAVAGRLRQGRPGGDADHRHRRPQPRLHHRRLSRARQPDPRPRPATSPTTASPTPRSAT